MITRGWACAILVASTVAMTSACVDQAETTSSEGSPPQGSAGAAELIVECLRDKGWHAIAHEDGSVQSPEMPTGQVDLYVADEDACVAGLGYDDYPEITDEVARQYFASMKESAECLANLGISVPEPPSEEAFVEAMVTRRESIWSYAEGVDGSQDVATNEEIDDCLDLLGR